MTFCLVILLIVILGSLVSVETRPIVNWARIDESSLTGPLTGFNARMGYDKVPTQWGPVQTIKMVGSDLEGYKKKIIKIDRSKEKATETDNVMEKNDQPLMTTQSHSMQESSTSSSLSKEKGMKNKNPIDDLVDDLVELSFEKLIKKRIDYFTLISGKISNLEKYLGFASVPTSKEQLPINQTQGDVEAQRQKLTMDLLSALYTLEHSGSLPQLLSHEQQKNQTIVDKLKPALSNLRIKVDRLKAFNEEDMKIMVEIFSTNIPNINTSTMTEEIKKTRAKEAETRANETLGATFASGQNFHGATSVQSTEEIQIQAKISSAVIPDINTSTMTEETMKTRTKEAETGANEILGATFASGQNFHGPTSVQSTEEIQIQAKISPTIIPSINTSTMTEETMKTRAKGAESRANETLRATFTLGQNFHEPTSVQSIEEIQAKISSTIIRNINTSTMTEETMKTRAKEAETRANETLEATFALGQNFHEPTRVQSIEETQAKISSTITPNINSSTMTEKTRKIVNKTEYGANDTKFLSEHTRVGVSTTLPQILAAIGNDYELSLTNTSDTNGNKKKNDPSSVRNATLQYVIIIAGVFGGLIVVSSLLAAYTCWRGECKTLC